MGIWPFLALMLGVSGVVRIAPVVPQRWRVLASLAVLLAFLCWAPFTLDDFRLFQIQRIGVFALTCLGLNILTGYNGQISLGHGAFMLLGTYTSAVLMDGTKQMSFVDAQAWPFWATIIVAGGVAAVAGFLLGFPALRLSGPYLAIATLALVISFPIIIRKYSEFTGGAQGLRFPQPPPPPFLEGLLDRAEWLYFLVLLAVVLMVLMAWNLLRGPVGRAFVAVRDSEIAAAAMGIDVARVKVTAFTVSAFYAGVAGGVFAQITGSVTPESVDIVQSINFLTGIVIGGLASIAGSVIGAALLVFIPSDAARIVGNLLGIETIVTRAPGAIQGAAVILVIILMPYGIAGAARRLLSLRWEAVLPALRGLPAGLGRQGLRLPGRASWAWEIRPWARRGQANPAGREDVEKSVGEMSRE